MLILQFPVLQMIHIFFTCINHIYNVNKTKDLFFLFYWSVFKMGLLLMGRWRKGVTQPLLINRGQCWGISGAAICLHVGHIGHLVQIWTSNFPQLHWWMCKMYSHARVISVIFLRSPLLSVSLSHPFPFFPVIVCLAVLRPTQSAQCLLCHQESFSSAAYADNSHWQPCRNM